MGGGSKAQVGQGHVLTDVSIPPCGRTPNMLGSELALGSLQMCRARRHQQKPPDLAGHDRGPAGKWNGRNTRCFGIVLGPRTSSRCIGLALHVRKRCGDIAGPEGTVSHPRRPPGKEVSHSRRGSCLQTSFTYPAKPRLLLRRGASLSLASYPCSPPCNALLMRALGPE
jgi:hypothetical protein